MIAVSADSVRAYGVFYQTVTPDSIRQLGALCASDIVFCDPFNEIRGLSGFSRVFEHMFEVLDSPRFDILDTAISGRTAYFKWRFTALTKRGRMNLDLVGMTEAVFRADGLVSTHIDYWDSASQLHARLPLIGGVFGWFNRRFAVPA